MWYRIGQQILKYRVIWMIVLLSITLFMGYQSSKIQLGYEFTKAIPTDNPKAVDYVQFKSEFGDDGNTLVIGVATDSFWNIKFFNSYYQLHHQLKKIKGVEDVLSIPEAMNIVRIDSAENLVAQKIFKAPYTSQEALEQDAAIFKELPFYQQKLYNDATQSYLMAVTVNRSLINSKYRTKLIGEIQAAVKQFETATNTNTFLSGLPFIRTSVGNRIKDEMNWFLIGSLLLSAITLLVFFRSISAMIMSLLVVGFGVVWSLGTMDLMGYKISLLTALIPPLIVVIGVPNCIYFLNKFHMSFKEGKTKEEAIVHMIGRMGIVTLFCNIAAAIGFAVFALTKSELLKEFGLVAGINIMALFFISLLFIPICLSYLPTPKPQHVKYLSNKFLETILLQVEKWVLKHPKIIYSTSIVVVVFSLLGIVRLKSEGFIVDDLPKTDKIYTDLKWFENNFEGVMPLEIVVDTKKKNGLLRGLKPIQQISEFSDSIAAHAYTSKPLSFVEGLKFARQAFYDGDVASYDLPSSFDIAFLAPYLKGNGSAHKTGGFNKLINSFMDSTRQKARISVNMKDIGSSALPQFLDSLQLLGNKILDTANYQVTYTGSTVTFLEGTRFIINGLKESIFWAFLLIALCMLYLFKSVRILLCSLIPNLIPLLATAGLMGWLGIPLKPSTVLIFSVALGIVIDVTIRFLINYKQELPHFNFQNTHTVVQTIKNTGISIIYTSLVLIAGFIIFYLSDFGGTKALGWLTSFTLIVGTVTNMILLPVLLKTFAEKSSSKKV